MHLPLLMPPPLVYSAGGVAPTQFFLDNFTDVNGTLLTAHVPDSGGSWSVISGTGVPTIQTNRVFCATANGVAKASAVAPLPNGYVEAVFDLITDAVDNIGVCAHLTGAINGYFVRYNQATDVWTMFRFDAGTPTAISGDFADNWNSGSRTVRIQFDGSTINFYNNGVLALTAQDTNYRSGSPGIRFGTVQTSATLHHCTSIIGVAQ